MLHVVNVIANHTTPTVLCLHCFERLLLIYVRLNVGLTDVLCVLACDDHVLCFFDDGLFINCCNTLIVAAKRIK